MQPINSLPWSTNQCIQDFKTETTITQFDRYRFHIGLIFGGVFLLVLLSGCGGGGSSSSSGGEEPVVIGVEEGILLTGAETSTAVDSTVNLVPKAVPNEYIQDRLLTTRLVAVLDLNATVAEVNQVLIDNGASIVTMLEGQPFVTLAIDPVADLAEALAKVQALKDSGVFIYVRPGLQSPLTANASSSRVKNFKNRGRDFRSSRGSAARQPADGYVDHVLSSRFPAAWNLRRAASHDASLVHPNSYASLNEIGQYDQLPLLSVTAAGSPIDTSDPVFGRVGNIGYHYMGIAAGENLFDGSQNRKLGADPVAIQYLDAYGYHANGLDESDLWAYLYLQWPASGNTVLLIDNTYNDPDQIYYSYLDRAWSGFTWRRIAHSIEAQHGPLLMLTPTGTLQNGSTPDDVTFNSAFAVATLPNIQAMVFLSNGSTTADQQAFIDFYNQTVENSPSLAAPLENVMLVGSSDASGNESSFSWPGAQVRAVGENVLGPCLISTNNFCDSNGYTLTSNTTIAAAAQVAGLASYLWHIDNQLTPAELLLRLQHAYSSSDIPGVIDARTAVLSLDTSLANARLRKTLLDVSGPGGQPDGVFDESDVNAFLTAFEAFEGATTPDWSVYDLNGDGWTNGTGTARMDLDVNNLPGFSVVSQTVGSISKSFNETHVTDTDVLCYYVYSSLYEGVVGDIPTISDCQAPPPPAGLTQLEIYGYSSGGFETQNQYFPGQNQEEVNDNLGPLANYVLSTTATTGSGASFFSGFSGDTAANQTFSMTENPQGLVVLTLSFNGSASANAAHNGYDGSGDAKRVGTSSNNEIVATFYLSEPLNFNLTGGFTGGGSGDQAPGGMGRGRGEVFLRGIGNGTNDFSARYFSDFHGAALNVNESGVLQPGFYELTVWIATSAGTDFLNITGGSYNSFIDSSITLQLSR